MISSAVMMLLGSVFLWWFHIDYYEYYKTIKEDNKNFTKKEICSILCKNDYKIILVLSLIFYIINPSLLMISIGALITFITVKIPSLASALESE